MFVLDASTTIAWCIPDEVTAPIERVFDELKRTTAMAPAIWPLEVANAFLLARRRQRLTDARAVQILEQLQLLPIIVEECSTERAFTVILGLARQYNLSAYDAAYLELALRRGLPLASNDRRLSEAARRCGVDLLL